MQKIKIKFLVLFGVLLILNNCVAQTNKEKVLPYWAFVGFARTSANPIITPDSNSAFLDPISNNVVNLEGNYTLNPAAVLKDGKVIVLYRSEDKTGTEIGTRTSRRGLAESIDGIHFKRKSVSVLFPANNYQKEFEWPGGCEDPRVAVAEKGIYVMFCSQWNRKVPRVGVATSKDLVHWTKHGPIFKKAYKGKFFNIPHKSAAILTKVKNGKLVIEKIHDKYWMYWGEHHVYAATSTNLTDWKPLVDERGALLVLMSPKKDYFDSDLTGCGSTCNFDFHRKKDEWDPI